MAELAFDARTVNVLLPLPGVIIFGVIYKLKIRQNHVLTLYLAVQHLIQPSYDRVSVFTTTL